VERAVPTGKRHEQKQPFPLGRPKNQEKRIAILEAARTHFFNKGFDAVTMEGVAAAAGVSKMTVYGHFSDKETLFQAFVEREVQTLRALLTQLPLTLDDLRNTLITFGMAFLDFITRPEVIQFNRLLISVAPRQPQLARQFFDAGPATVYAALAELLHQAVAAQELCIPNLERAADQLMAMWQSIDLMKFQLSLVGTLSLERRLEYVEDCVDTMIRAWSVPCR
jgi:TetR/AcrR family transcriptional repressor of mexJK operon